MASEQRTDAFLGTLTANSPTRHIFFDKLGRQRAVQDERGFVNTTEWDAGGNLARERFVNALTGCPLWGFGNAEVPRRVFGAGLPGPVGFPTTSVPPAPSALASPREVCGPA